MAMPGGGMMLRKKFKHCVMALGAAGWLMTLFCTVAQALPSSSRQTGMTCSACHTVFPELTPMGRTFKLSAYNLSKSNKSYEFPPPLSAGAFFGFTNVETTMPPGTAPYNSRGNDNVNAPQDVDLYYGGKIYGNLGSYTQGRYCTVENKFKMYQSDLRYARTTTLGGRVLNLVYGITLNNNPTYQDVWNSTPARNFHYVFSGVAPFPLGLAKIYNGLAMQVGGLGLYAFWNDLVYVETSLYRTARYGPFQFLGAGVVTEQLVDGFAPYWRLALQHNWNNHSLMLGTYGMAVGIYPEGQSTGPSDRFTDVAFDAQYQYTLKRHLFSAQIYWIHEEQNRDASYALEKTAKGHNSLNNIKVTLNYWYRSSIGTLGGSWAFVNNTGTRDMLLYRAAPLNGSINGRPNNNYFILEADYLPWSKTKISIQYIMYNRFNGGRTNYDGYGRNADENNTLYLNVWFII